MDMIGSFGPHGGRWVRDSLALQNALQTGLFQTVIRRPQGEKLGLLALSVDIPGYGSGMYVESVQSAGAIANHNLTCDKDKVIGPGDCIIRAGSAVLDHSLIYEVLSEVDEITVAVIRHAELDGKNVILPPGIAMPKLGPSHGGSLNSLNLHQHKFSSQLSEVSTSAPLTATNSLKSRYASAQSSSDWARGFGVYPNVPHRTAPLTPANFVSAPGRLQEEVMRGPQAGRSESQSDFFSAAARQEVTRAHNFASVPNISSGGFHSGEGIYSMLDTALGRHLGESAFGSGLEGQAPGQGVRPSSVDTDIRSMIMSAMNGVQPSAADFGGASMAQQTRGQQATNGKESTAKPEGKKMKKSTSLDVSPPTTLILRQLPDTYTRDMLVELLNRVGFKGLFDFVYMPMNLRTQATFTYAFVNLVRPEVAQACHHALDGFTSWDVPHGQPCVASWANALQGLRTNIERYCNSPVMHPSVPDSCKPALYKDGVRIAMPAPTKAIKAPAMRKLYPPSDARSPEEQDGAGMGASVEDPSLDLPQQPLMHEEPPRDLRGVLEAAMSLVPPPGLGLGLDCSEAPTPMTRLHLGAGQPQPSLPEYSSRLGVW